MYYSLAHVSITMSSGSCDHCSLLPEAITHYLVLTIAPPSLNPHFNTKSTPQKINLGKTAMRHDLIMNDSGKKDHLSKLLNMRMAIVEVGIAETNEEAWRRHLATHPGDLHANVRIFNRANLETAKVKDKEGTQIGK